MIGDGLLHLVADGGVGLDLPQRRARGIFGARGARGVDALAQDLLGVLLDAVGAIGRQPRIVLHQHAEVVEDAFLHVVGDVGIAGELGVAVGLQQRHVAGRGDALGALVVGDDVGLDDLALAQDFDIAAGDEDAEALVVADLVGDHPDGLAVSLLGPGRSRSARSGRGPWALAGAGESRGLELALQLRRRRIELAPQLFAGSGASPLEPSPERRAAQAGAHDRQQAAQNDVGQSAPLRRHDGTITPPVRTPNTLSVATRLVRAPRPALGRRPHRAPRKGRAKLSCCGQSSTFFMALAKFPRPAARPGEAGHGRKACKDFQPRSHSAAPPRGRSGPTGFRAFSPRGHP